MSKIIFSSKHWRQGRPQPSFEHEKLTGSPILVKFLHPVHHRTIGAISLTVLMSGRTIGLGLLPHRHFLGFRRLHSRMMLPEALKTMVIESRLMSGMEGALRQDADSNEKWIDDTAR
jgi:hypothetical protein